MESRKRTGFLAKWILLTIASMFLYNVTLYFGLRGWLAQLASAAGPSLQNPLSTAIALAIQLSMIGFSQWLLIRNRFERAYYWIALPALGQFAVGFVFTLAGLESKLAGLLTSLNIVLTSLPGFLETIPVLILSSSIVAVFHSMAMASWSDRPFLWIPIYVSARLIGFVVFFFLSMILHDVTFAIVTGLGFNYLISRREQPSGAPSSAS